MMQSTESCKSDNHNLLKQQCIIYSDSDIEEKLIAMWEKNCVVFTELVTTYEHYTVNSCSPELTDTHYSYCVMNGPLVVLTDLIMKLNQSSEVCVQIVDE